MVSYDRGLKTVMRLQPLRYEYEPNNAMGLNSVGERIGLRRTRCAASDTEAVTKNAEGLLDGRQRSDHLDHAQCD